MYIYLFAEFLHLGYIFISSLFSPDPFKQNGDLPFPLRDPQFILGRHRTAHGFLGKAFMSKIHSEYLSLSTQVRQQLEKLTFECGLAQD